MGGRQHRTTPAGQIFGGREPATPAALTPMRLTYLFTYLFKHRRQRAEATYMPIKSYIEDNTHDEK